MKVNTILICAGIIIVLTVQLFLFRFQRVDSYLFLNRYTGTVYTYADMMVQPKSPSESSKVKKLQNDLEIAKSKLIDKDSMIRKLRDETFQISKGLAKAKSEIPQKNTDINNKAARLCYLMKCAGIPQSAMNHYIMVDGQGSTWAETIHVIMKQREELEKALIAENNKAPE